MTQGLTRPLQPNVRLRSTYMSLGTGRIIPGRYDPEGMSCDWGDCENEAPVFLRLSLGQGWLPVCDSCARKPEPIWSTRRAHDVALCGCFIGPGSSGHSCGP